MNLSPRSSTLYLGLAVASAILATRGEAGELYSQPPMVSSGSYTTWSSAYTDTSLDYFQTLDNFEVSSSATLGSLTWQGMYLNYNGAYSNGAPDTVNWLILLYTGGGGSNFPYTLYASETVSAASATETLAGTTNFENISVNYYNESLSLPTGIAIQGGQTYYLSIFSDNGGSTDSWSWMSGTGGDGTSYQYDSYNNSTYSKLFDRAFSLYAAPAPVPEPSSIFLGLIGFTGLGAALRLRRVQRTTSDNRAH